MLRDPSPSSSGGLFSSLPPEQRSRLFRSARKLEQVLGTNAFLIESTGARRPLQVLPAAAAHPRPVRHKRSQSFTTTSVEPESRPTPRPGAHQHDARRLGSIFDLSEDELRTLQNEGIHQLYSRDLPKIVTNDKSRPSFDSTASMRSSPVSLDHSSLFSQPVRSGASSVRTSLSFDSPANSRAASPQQKLTPVSHTHSPSTKRKRGADAPPLFITVKPVAIPAGDDRLNTITPHTAPLDYVPSTPCTPSTPTDTELAETRRRKLSRVMRTLGENVPPELVLGTVEAKKSRRASLVSTVEIQLPASRTSIDSVYSDTDARSVPVDDIDVPTSTHFGASLKHVRSRTTSTARAHRPRVPFASAAAEGYPILITHLQESVEPFEAPLPVFSSGVRQPESERWVGAWNRPDIHAVQKELRALRWR